MKAKKLFIERLEFCSDCPYYTLLDPRTEDKPFCKLHVNMKDIEFSTCQNSDGRIGRAIPDWCPLDDADAVAE